MYEVYKTMDLTEMLPQLICTIAGVFAGGLLSHFIEWLKQAKLGFDDKLFIECFQNSARFSLRVKHVGGSLPVTNAIGYVTIDVEDASLDSITIRKKDRDCEYQPLCSRCSGKSYLASAKSKIESEPLSWSISVDVGVGLDNFRYRHVTHIPVGGSVLLRLFDVYLAEVYGPLPKGELKERFWLVKVHSEYGVDVYPRICLKLPFKSSTKPTTITFRIAIAGENLRKKVETEIKLVHKGEDIEIKYRNERKSMRKLFEDERIGPLQLRSKGAIY